MQAIFQSNIFMCDDGAIVMVATSTTSEEMEYIEGLKASVEMLAHVEGVDAFIVHQHVEQKQTLSFL